MKDIAETPEKKKNDKIFSKPDNKQNYYNSKSGMSTMDVIEDFGIENDFYLANALKYILRAGKKPDNSVTSDLEKAIWYLNRKIYKINNQY